MRLEYASGFIVFDALMQNERFRNRFFSRYLEVIEVTFEPNRVQQIIEDYIAMLEGEYRLHYLKWGGMNFNEVVEDLRDIGEFNEKRAKWIRPLILQWYNETL